MSIAISMVIPTCNRRESLLKTLQGASLQTCPVAEIIIVDASAPPIGSEIISQAFPDLPVRYFTSRPSVCAQRNFGIKMAENNYVLLCDDDVEMPPDYLQKVCGYLSEHADAGIATGLFLQKNKDEVWEYQYRSASFSKCLFNFIFQLSCWGDFEAIKTNFITAPILNKMKKWYAQRGNTYSLAGWPLLTDFPRPVTRTAVYSLGAAVVKKEWLLASSFEEKLVANGIGENYGVTLNLPEPIPIHLLTEAFVWHHHAPENRLKMLTAYRYRMYALHFFMKNSNKFSAINMLFLYWSILGNCLLQLFSLQGKLAAASISTMIVLVFGQNPYVKHP